jgi:hypothetical protein
VNPCADALLSTYRTPSVSSWVDSGAHMTLTRRRSRIDWPSATSDPPAASMRVSALPVSKTLFGMDCEYLRPAGNALPILSRATSILSLPLSSSLSSSSPRSALVTAIALSTIDRFSESRSALAVTAAIVSSRIVTFRASFARSPVRNAVCAAAQSCFTSPSLSRPRGACRDWDRS